ncbi:hypothetical protein HAX54_001456 [Datura stramonium]|uniref:Uncharacterized protein n=1 Tax=Datura stramonium TaxID=4076 RepID=A0ABS8WTE2_DATST|nr:hypothetical protein [Datura stramonium]
MPSWIFSLPSLEVLDMNNNHFSGRIQEFKSQMLNSIDLRHNQLQAICNATTLGVLDLGSNYLKGTIPQCLGEMGEAWQVFDNFRAMKIIDENMRTPRYEGVQSDSVTITTKVLDLEFAQVLTADIVIDLSRNDFEGLIPSILGDLIGLRTLNLSHNGLEVLNLSHNHLVGCIPKGNQFDTFENSSCQGNGLRGFPLSRDFGDDGVAQTTTPFVLDQGERGDLANKVDQL